MDNLEEVPAGGRVTRSLRKRLTSIDSEASSRPGTPLGVKAASSNDLNSPARPTRMTRRNSVTGTTTPAKTPSKSVASRAVAKLEVSEPNSPLRRTTRRNSASIVEEEPQPTIKSFPQFEVLAEEDSSLETPIAKRQTRSSSKSPLQLNTNEEGTTKSPKSAAKTKRTSKPGPKSKTKKNINDDCNSEVEVIDLEEDTLEPSDKKIHDDVPKVPESSEETVKTDIETPSKANTTQETSKLNSVETPKNALEMNKTKQNSTTPRNSPKFTKASSAHRNSLTNKTETVEKPSQNKTTETPQDIENEKENNKLDSNQSVEIIAKDTNPSPLTTPKKRKSSVVITEVRELECLSPEKMVSITAPSKESRNSLSDKKKNRPDKLKSVAFNGSPEENEAKSVYPKTPGLTKSKSYIDMDSSREDQENTSFTGENCEKIELKEEVAKTLTPYKSKLLKSLNSSTPIPTAHTSTTNCNANEISPDKFLRSGTSYGNSPTNTSPTKKKTSISEQNNINSSMKSPKKISIQENNDVSTTVSENNHKSNTEKKDSSFARSWHLNVSGTANTSAKLDAIEDEKAPVQAPLEEIEIVDSTGGGSAKKRHSRFESDDDENIEAENQHEEDEIEELDDDEKPYKKHDFVDGEAMEVDDDYQSGDSMDSEERRDIEENEIPVDGESIGSTDTDEEHVEEEGEDDDEEDSFIANDSDESLLEYSDEDEGVKDEDERGDKNKRKKKKYTRILRDETDSDADHDHDDKMSSHDGEVQALVLEVSKMIDDTNMFDEEDANESETKESTVKQRRSSINNMNEKNEKKSKQIDMSQVETVELDESVIDLDATCSADVSRKTRRKSLKKEHCEMENVSEKSNTSLKEKTKSPNKSKNDSIVDVLNRSSRKSIQSEETTPPNSDTCNKSIDSNINTSKLSESALLLHEKDECENIQDDDGLDEESEEELNISRKKIIKNLNQSERFNKTVHELNEDNEEETSPEVENAAFDGNNSRTRSRRSQSKNKSLRKSICESSTENSNEEIPQEEKVEDPSNENKDNQCDEDESLKSTENLNELKYESDSDSEEAASKRKSLPVSTSHDRTEFNSKKRSSLHGLEVKKNVESDSSTSEGSDSESQQVTFKQTNKSKAAGLSVSFGYSKTKKLDDDTVGGKFLHNSFTIGVSVTKKSNVEEVQPNSSNSSDDDSQVENNSKSDSTSSADRISSEEEEQLNKLQHVHKVGNQLTRRQSLANIARSKDNSKLAGTKSNRRSICIPDSSDFNPSQSFIENVSDRKKEFAKQSAKRKRLSKSFCGGSLDTTDVEIEERHLHKKSKLLSTNKKKSNPVDDNQVNDDNNNIRRILGRCEEILEAANRAKLEAKQNYNKSKVRIPKKKHVKKVEKIEEKLEEIKEEEVVTKGNQEKRKVEIEKALKASVGIILNNPKKKEKPEATQVTQNFESKRLPKDVLDVIADGEPVPKKKKAKDPIPPSDMDQENIRKVHKFKTSAGEVLEMPVQKKKKAHKTEIELPTGTVRIEPITPRKQRVQHGFCESPNTPIGFKVRKILTAGQDTPPMLPSSKAIKRKRIIEEPKHSLPKPQWTQSGQFIEEELNPCSAGRKSKKSVVTKVQPLSAVNSALQFKRTALCRDNIPRESTRELLQRKERKHTHKHF